MYILIIVTSIYIYTYWLPNYSITILEPRRVELKIMVFRCEIQMMGSRWHCGVLYSLDNDVTEMIFQSVGSNLGILGACVKTVFWFGSQMPMLLVKLHNYIITYFDSCPLSCEYTGTAIASYFLNFQHSQNHGTWEGLFCKKSWDFWFFISRAARNNKRKVCRCCSG